MPALLGTAQLSASDANITWAQRLAATRRLTGESSLPRLEETVMRQRLPMTALALIAPVLVGACATGAASRPAASPVTSLAAVTAADPATPVASVQGFYRSYAAARNTGQRLAEAVVRSHVAAWYVP